MVAIGNVGQPTCRAEFWETRESQHRESTTIFFCSKKNDQNKLAPNDNALRARNCRMLINPICGCGHKAKHKLWLWNSAPKRVNKN